MNYDIIYNACHAQCNDIVCRGDGSILEVEELELVVYVVHENVCDVMPTKHDLMKK